MKNLLGAGGSLPSWTPRVASVPPPPQVQISQLWNADFFPLETWKKSLAGVCVGGVCAPLGSGKAIWGSGALETSQHFSGGPGVHRALGWGHRGQRLPGALVWAPSEAKYCWGAQPKAHPHLGGEENRNGALAHTHPAPPRRCYGALWRQVEC